MHSPFRDSNGIVWVDGSVQCHTDVRHANVGGSVHGGLMATMLDSAMGGTIITRLKGRRAVTSQMSVSYLEPARVGEVLVARAHVSRIGRTLAYAEATLVRGSDDAVVATASGVFALANGKATG